MSGGESTRGAALLVVLFTIAVVSVAAAAVAGLAAIARSARVATAAQREAVDLLDQADGLVRTWLDQESTAVVLGTDVLTPAVAVRELAWSVGGEPRRMQVTAFDQCGMASAEAVAQGSTLRLAVPEAVARAADLVTGGDVPPGLDLLASAVESAFPTAAGDQAVGALLATHVEAPGRIHVWTAPEPLLAAALDLAGRSGDLQVILQARAQGTKLGLAATAGGVATDLAPAIVTASDVWSFRIDVEVGAVRQSWWSTYRGGAGSWSCVQRLAIPD
ncbi:MAG TPA: hypothetical protein VJP77_05070 [Planctomycetota bacterium]|nr:hypothetical protein [Planctomycetota bacterium]